MGAQLLSRSRVSFRVNTGLRFSGARRRAHLLRAGDAPGLGLFMGSPAPPLLSHEKPVP